MLLLTFAALLDVRSRARVDLLLASGLAAFFLFPSEAMATRKPISKRVRFEIFTRDNFTCRYCGRQSDEVILVIDHLTPVCKGGGNNKENLLTSCEGCNQGKGGKAIAQHAPTESDRLRLLQEHREQVATQKAVVAIVKARQRVRQEICNQICAVFQREHIDNKTLNVLVSYADRFGIDKLLDWIAIAAVRLPHYASDEKIGRYISGIKKHCLEKGEIADE